MQRTSPAYFAAYQSLKFTRDAEGVLLVEFHTNGGPLTAHTAHEWGVVAEVVPNGEALARARELASLYLKASEVTRGNTRAHFIQPLKERIVWEVGYGLSLEGASAADLVKSMQAKKLSDSLRRACRLGQLRFTPL
jgi:enoyl-CoA hydratase/carnithine racemase